MNKDEKLLLLYALIWDIRSAWTPCKEVGTRDDPRAFFALELLHSLDDELSEEDSDALFADFGRYISGKWEGKIIWPIPLAKYVTLPFSPKGRSDEFCKVVSKYLKTPTCLWD